MAHTQPKPLRSFAPLALVWLALALRLGYIAAAPEGMQLANVDAQGYHWLAVNLIERGVYSMNTEPPYRSDNIRAPLYPLFVAGWYSIAGPEPRLVALAQAALDAVTVGLAFCLGKRIAGRRVGWVTALLYALTPAAWRFCNELLTEILFGLLLTASLWMFARYILGGKLLDAAGCGLLSGASILCKPNVQFLPIVLVGILVRGLVLKKTGHGGFRKLQGLAHISWWRGALLIAAIIGLMLGPWVVRNKLVFGQWFYTRTFDDNLAHVSAVATLARAGGESVAPWTPRWESLYDEVIARAAARYSWTSSDESALSTRERDRRLQQITTVALDIIRAHPLDFIASHTSSWLWSFLPQDHKFWYTLISGQAWEALPAEGDALGRALSAVEAGDGGAAAGILVRERLLALPPLALALWAGWGLSYLLTALLFAAGTWRLRPRVLALVLLATIFYVTFLPGPISAIRFRLPVLPAIWLLAVSGARLDASPGQGYNGREGQR
ncbi:MAG: glycosyltransferase family 39 protein [Thermoflexales bacterium]|nr:glycosyltransferase family 39 protein [Thermoflexales bacterium]